MTYACLYLREFPAQALLRLRPELRGKPVVVMENQPPLEQVCSLNAKGRERGIVHGMTPVEVDTFSGVTVLPRSLKEEAATKAVLLECAGSFSPRVEDCCEDSASLCVVDIAGTERLFVGRSRSAGAEASEASKGAGNYAAASRSAGIFKRRLRLHEG